MPVVSMRLKVGTQPSVSSKNTACMFLKKFHPSCASVSQEKLWLNCSAPSENVRAIPTALTWPMRSRKGWCTQLCSAKAFSASWYSPIPSSMECWS